MASRLDGVAAAVQRARWPILSIAAAYTLSVGVGIVMVHSGNRWALASGDRIVGEATVQDPAAIADAAGRRYAAALWDFAGNLVLGAIPKTIAGFATIPPYPMVAYQGWVGGIVSVRGDHSSRFDTMRSATYYLLTLFLQLVPYSLAVGGGVNVGVAMLRPLEEKWVGILPKAAVRDLGRIYALVIPLFFVASLWEFLSPWNQ